MFFITKVIIMLLAHLMRTRFRLIIVLLLAALPVMVGRYCCFAPNW